MMVTRFQVLVSQMLLLMLAVYAQGQTEKDHSYLINAPRIAEMKPDHLTAEPNAGEPARILAYRSHNESSFANNQPAPAYSEVIDGRVGQLSVDWVAPKSIMIGQEVDFELVVRNRGPVAAQDIQIEPMLPVGSELVRANPIVVNNGRKPIWQIASLGPQEEYRITLSLILSSIGAAKTDARITYSTSTSTTINVVQPKLEIAAEGPESSIVGDNLFFHVVVTNPGTGPTQNTSLKVFFPEGIDRVAESADYDIGSLNPGESRSIRVAGNMAQLGQHECQFVATSDYGLRDEASTRVVGLGAKLDLDIAGPSLRYLNRPAKYTLRVANNGTAAASKVYIRSAIPRPFAFVQADNSGSFDSVNKNITWFVDRLEPKQEVEFNFQLLATTAGSIPIHAEVDADRGLHDDADHITDVKGIAAILVEVVDVIDPVEVGVETFYEIIVTNQGSAFANDVVVTAEIPEEMEVIGSQGPSKATLHGRKLHFEKLDKLAPRADAIYRVKVRGIKAKDVRIRVEVDAESLDSPVLELESTKVYED